MRMHVKIHAKAAESGFSEKEGNLLVLPFGAEEVQRIIEALKTWGSGVGRRYNCLPGPEVMSGAGIKGGYADAQVIDTIVLIRSLCSVPGPRETLRALVDALLVPGGQLLFLEHVRNPRKDVAWWQDMVAPMWKYAFDGYVIGLDGVGIIRDAIEGDEREGSEEGKRGWKEMEVSGVEGEDVERALFWHQFGRCVKP